MKGRGRHAHARTAIICIPVGLLDVGREDRYPPYVGLLIAIGGSALLWAMIGWAFAKLT
ncbi:hypothetical protein Swit_0876 [Rhizorhabdus wittichii RW1]|jgi:hypothetical protein|uniref:Uncharacterized protein n=1 Tax=Rhizorhabdus wittichii (strain DSM 6014 / CCUG 31198 / JCM 15750 / NBRC 105917 / EY 4224 / RW1) TaxID=392499 RepID=A0A9J9H971_RHIWR|nr:hypothetical protein Swit_0876 [Rhizorhabdus wittichii RW1]